MNPRLLCLVALASACSSRGGNFGFDTDASTDAPTADAGTPVDDSGTPPVDDSGTPPADAGPGPDDAGAPPTDLGPSTSCVSDRDCSALNLVCDRGAGRCVDCVTDTDCLAGRFCSAAQACTPQVCTPGQSACLGTSRQSACDARGSAQQETDCGAGETCRAGRCQPTACTPGGSTCDSATGQRRVCNADGSGTRLEACPAGQRCSGGSCVALACVPDSRECVDGALRVCNSSGSSATNTACPTRSNATRTCTDGACGFACSAGFGDCDGSAANGCEASLTTTARCGACGVACAGGQACRDGACATTPSGGFRVTSLGITGCRTVDHDSVSGDDRGGIAVSSQAVFYSGDSSTARLSLDLASPTRVGVIHDALFSDLATGDAYVLLDATGVELTNTSGLGTTTVVTQLGRLNASGTVMATRVPLTPLMTIYTGRTDPMIFSGYGQLVVYAGSSTGTGAGVWYAVNLSDGAVRTLATLPAPTHQLCESWAAWGIAESVGDDISVMYVESSTNIARFRLSSRAVTRTPFVNVGDMCSMSLSTSRNRWYFHMEGPSQFFSGNGEYLGYCDAAWSTGP